MNFRMRYAHPQSPPPARTALEHTPREHERPRLHRRGPHPHWPAETSLRLVLRAAVGMVFFVLGYLKFFETIPLGTEAVALPRGVEGFGQYLGLIGVPLPLLSAYVVCLVEMICGPALLVSAFLPAPAVLTRLSALPLMVAMTVATLTVGVPNLLGEPVLLHGVAITAQAWRFPLETAQLAIAVLFLWRPLPKRRAPLQ